MFHDYFEINFDFQILTWDLFSIIILIILFHYKINSLFSYIFLKINFRINSIIIGKYSKMKCITFNEKYY